MAGIGALNETPFHAALKAIVAPPGACFEVVVDGYVIDVVAAGLLIEVQTRHVGKMRLKLERLLAHHRVRLVLPVSEERWIVKRGVDGPGRRRRSPKRGGVAHALFELVAIPKLLDHPNLEIEVVVVREEEEREYRPGAAWRKRGWVTVDRRLLGIGERRLFRGARAWLELLPADLPPTFTTLDLVRALGVTRSIAQRAAYVLRESGAVACIGTKERSRLYVRTPGT
ncbi:hypothetical protein BH23DEI1_BH23DEI1_01180 [soil metagenome]|nr:hypothetical protein [Trueperaceae bacterium]